MATIQTEVELQADRGKTQKEISGALEGVQVKAAGEKLGNEFGNAFGRIFQRVASVLAFASLKAIGDQAVAYARKQEIANQRVIGTLEEYQVVQKNNIALIKDEKASLEEKAFAIGYNVDKIYENTKATAGLNTESRNLERQLRFEQRAFEDQTRKVEQALNVKENEQKIIQKTIESINKETQARIRQIQVLRGVDPIEEELRGLQLQKDKLRLQQAEMELSNDPNKAINLFLLQNQIQQLDREINLRQARLVVIRHETDAIGRQGEAQKQTYEQQLETVRNQIELTREELRADRNKFDIDTFEARRKLEDLRDTARGVAGAIGGAGAPTQSFLDALADYEAKYEGKGKEDIDKNAKQIDDEINRVLNDFARPSGVTRAALATAAAEIMATGLSDPEAIGKALQSFTVISAKAPPGQARDEVIKRMGQDFRLGMSTPSTGMPDSYNVIAQRGFAQLSAQGVFGDKQFGDLTGAEKSQAKVAGLDDVYTRSISVFDARKEGGDFQQDIANAARIEAMIALGEAIRPVFESMQGMMVPFMEMVAQFMQANPELTGALFLLAFAVSGVVAIISFLGIKVAAVVGAVVLLFAGLKKAWDDDAGGIQTRARELWEEFEEMLAGIGLDFGGLVEILKQVASFFMGRFVTGIVGAVNIVLDVFQGAIKMIGGFIDIFKGIRMMVKGEEGGLKLVFEGIGKALSAPFIASGNIIISVLNSVIQNVNKLIEKIPSNLNILNIKPLPEMKKLGFFEGFDFGGMPQGRNRKVVMNESGQESILNARATGHLMSLMKEVDKMFTGGDVDNSSTTNYYNFGGSDVDMPQDPSLI